MRQKWVTGFGLLWFGYYVNSNKSKINKFLFSYFKWKNEVNSFLNIILL